MTRSLPDDTLVVFLSDCHIGGDAGRDIFESPDDLAELFADLDRHPHAVELVLGGDFFDFLRIADVPAGQNRASATLSRPEYQDLFAALRRFAAGQNHRIVYLPGNHDAEAWWNEDIRAELLRQGIVHEFALSYAAAFSAEPGRIVYCEHGNEFDPANRVTDYNDRLDTPLGDHIVTDLMPRLPKGRAIALLHLSDIDRVFPLTTIPEWLIGRLFYELVTQTIRWLMVPLFIVYSAYELVAYAFGLGHHTANVLAFRISYNVAWLVIVFAVFLLIVRRAANRALQAAPPRFRHPRGPTEPIDAAVTLIRSRLESRTPPPLADELTGEICVFVSGHTHAPSLTTFDRRAGSRGVQVNSGCWLRQLQPVAAHLRAPTVFVSKFEQTHVRVYRSGGETRVELWEHPRRSPQSLRLAERIAIIGRLPKESASGAPPRVRASAVVGR